jgi:hypothetical protein
VNLIVHGHAHHGQTEGRTTAGVPVYNVAMSLLMSRNGGQPYRIFEV